MTIFAGDKERNLANTVMDWLLNLGYLGLFLGTFLAGTVLPLSSDILLVGMLAAKADPLICLLARMVCQVGMARKMVQDKARHAPQAAGTGRQIRRMACDGLLGPLHRHGLHDRPGGIQGTPPDDGTPGAGRLLPPVFILDTAPDRLAAITRPAAGKPPHCTHPGTGRPSRRRKNGNFW